VSQDSALRRGQPPPGKKVTLLSPPPLRTAQEEFPFKQLKPFKRPFEDAVSQRLDLGDGLVDDNEDAVRHGVPVAFDPKPTHHLAAWQAVPYSTAPSFPVASTLAHHSPPCAQTMTG